jgi:putative Mg2+ transporter-C (MgtC) family protein
MTASLLGANTEGWSQMTDLATALVLSAAIGIEREIRQKSAGLRTHTLVGVGAALFMLISKYGFTDVLRPGAVILDPSRMAAQIVSGIGFLGAGLIFVRSDAVRGLTTAAAIWVTAAVGTAAGADLPVLAALATAMYFLVVLGFPPLVRHLPQSSGAVSVIGIRYLDGRGILRDVLRITTVRGFAVAEVATASGTDGRHRPQLPGDASLPQLPSPAPVVEVTLKIHGKGSVGDLAAALSEVDGVSAVLAGDVHNAAD